MKREKKQQKTAARLALQQLQTELTWTDACLEGCTDVDLLGVYWYERKALLARCRHLWRSAGEGALQE